MEKIFRLKQDRYVSAVRNMQSAFKELETLYFKKNRIREEEDLLKHSWTAVRLARKEVLNAFDDLDFDEKRACLKLIDLSALDFDSEFQK